MANGKTVLVIDGGLRGGSGRGNAVLRHLSQSPDVERILVSTDNVGMLRTEKVVGVPKEDTKDIPALRELIKREKPDLLLPLPEAPIVAGIIDNTRDLVPGFGLTKVGAMMMEGSKSVANCLKKLAGVRTAPFRVYHASERDEAIRDIRGRCVLKADGLAAGKGVTVVNGRAEAKRTFAEWEADKALKAASRSFTVEKCLEGEELSVICIFSADGKFVMLPAARDNKLRYSPRTKGRNWNTGGMAAWSDPSIATPALMQRIADEVFEPTIAAMRAMGLEECGVIYAGLMITPDGVIYTLEYNIRFGDPEIQAILPRVKTDLFPILLEIARGGSVENVKLQIDSGKSFVLVIVRRQYPQSASQVVIPEELLNPGEGVEVLHAGTAYYPDHKAAVLATGGRVLNYRNKILVPTLAEAAEVIYGPIGRKSKHDEFDWRGDFKFKQN
ncbi:MAG: ATP-grasp domain-containing protein [Candidatus Pacebacteria bacterium]|nr:ATP-grasp domain-containing protein [Candidatus Paceibacterota bacterium]